MYIEVGMSGILRSLIMSKNNQGPNLVPWVTLAGINSQSEQQDKESLTWCLRLVRKLITQ